MGYIFSLLSIIPSAESLSLSFETILPQLPTVGFNISNLNDYAIRFRVEARTILDGRELGLIMDRKGYYSGERVWLLDAFNAIRNGSFTIQEECLHSNGELTIEVRVIVIDENGREQKLSPKSWTYNRNTRSWFYEPTVIIEDK